MKSLSASIKPAAMFAVVITAATILAMAASMKISGPHPGANASTTAFYDTVVAAPNILVAGVTCNFRYVVRNGKRVKEEYCEDTR